MDVSKYAATSNYLSGAEMAGKTAKVVIASYREFKFENDEHPSLIIGFDGTDRELVLNKTNARILVADFGAEADAWIGKQITLTTQQYSMEGGLKHGIVIQTGNAEASDEIPF